jgi:hypothetical protein
MSTSIMTHPIAVAVASPLSKSRTAGFFWLMTMLTGTFAMLAYDRVFVAGNPAATATNISGHEALFRSAVAADLTATACYIVATLLVYAILKPVNRDVSLLAAFFSLVGCASASVSFVFRLVPVVALRAAQYLNVITPTQLRTLALTLLEWGAQANNISFAFFGLQCLLVGYLILRSTFLPRIVGVLMVCAGLSWITQSITNLLSPVLGHSLAPYILFPGLLGEGSLTLWLLVIGVNVHRWREQAIAANEWRSIAL